MACLPGMMWLWMSRTSLNLALANAYSFFRSASCTTSTLHDPLPLTEEFSFRRLDRWQKGGTGSQVLDALFAHVQ